MVLEEILQLLSSIWPGLYSRLLPAGDGMVSNAHGCEHWALIVKSSPFQVVNALGFSFALTLARAVSARALPQRCLVPRAQMVLSP